MYLSALERTSRLDAEFYSKENIVIYKLLQSKINKSIEQIANVSDGNHMSISYKFIEKGIPYYRGQNIHNYFIEESTPICIDEQTYNSRYLKRSHLKKGDVLLSIVGTIGGVALVSTNNKATCNCKLAILRPKDINGFYLSIFLKSKFGQNQIQKFKRGAVQMGLILEDMSQIYIPILSEDFQNKIEDLTIFSKSKSDKSKNLYTQAEELLLAELGLQDFSPNTESGNIKSFTDSFGASGRLDAEYYQPKYEKIEQVIRKYSNGFETLDKFISNYSTGYPYKSSSYISEDGIPLIRINNINKGSLDITNAVQVPWVDKKLSPRDIANENDILISMSGTIGNSCKIPKGIKALVNQRIMRITPKNFNHEVLPLLINSPIGTLQLNRIGTGGVQTNISSTDIKNILIPKIKSEKQQQIAALVEQSFTLKAQSEHLLEIAKRAVEIAIEEGEATAMVYIKKEAACYE